MEIAQYLIDAAKELLRYEGSKSLPQKLADSDFYLAKADDTSVMAFGVVSYEGIEYKIGPQTSKS